jgi:hypothetical protein
VKTYNFSIHVKDDEQIAQLKIYSAELMILYLLYKEGELSSERVNEFKDFLLFLSRSNHKLRHMVDVNFNNEDIMLGKELLKILETKRNDSNERNDYSKLCKTYGFVSLSVKIY